MAENLLTGSSVNASIPLSAQGPNIDPMKTAGQAVSLIGGLNQNKLFNAQFGARQAWGQAIQAATDPETGAVDMGRVMASLKGNPAAAQYLPEINQDALQASVQQQKLTQEHVTSARATLGAASEQLFPLLAQKAVITGPQFNSALQNIVKSGVLADPQSISAAANMAAQLAPVQKPDGTWDDTHTRQGVQQWFAQMHAGIEGLNTAFGSNTALNTGGTILTGKTDNFTGAITPTGPGIATTLTPGEEASRIPTTDQNGNPVSVPLSTTVDAHGKPLQPGAPGAAPQLAAGGALPAGPKLGQSAAAETAGAGSAVILNADRQAANASAPTIATLRKVYDLLGTTNTGPGTAVTNGWRSFVIAQAPMLEKLNPNFNADVLKTASTDELKKYMVQIATQQAASVGPHTNEGLATFSSGNANPDISNLANRDVTRMNIALARYQQAKMAAFDQSGMQPQDYAKFTSTFNRTVDPRAFMLDMLSPAERTKALSHITTASEKAAMVKGLNTAEAAGLFSKTDIPGMGK